MDLEPNPHADFPPIAAGEATSPESAGAERDRQRFTYQVCRLGFGILSLALLVACAGTLLDLSLFFGRHAVVVRLMNSSWWRWQDVPVVWGSLVGAYLLWGRWREPTWQRRAGLLLLMCCVDMFLWFCDHLGEIGLHEGEVGHVWLRNQLGAALGWAEFTLIASLACEFLAHLGVDNAPEAGKATRALARTGAVVWMIQFLERTHWDLGWPLLDRGIRTPETLLLHLGTKMIWTITLIQVTALTLTATRQGGRVLIEMALEDRRCDVCQSRSETEEFPTRS